MAVLLRTNSYAPFLRSINPARIRLLPSGLRHPEYDYWFQQWVKLRDCIEGEASVKAQSGDYLPSREGQDANDYVEYLGRAVFYNAVGRTLEGLYGSVFRRDPNVIADPAMEDLLDKCTRDGRSFATVCEDAVAEQLELGRVGVLVDTYDDAAEADEKGPYVCIYPAETIVHWDVREDKLCAVLLLEHAPKDPTKLFQSETTCTWRLLALDEVGDYYQASSANQEDLTSGIAERVYPVIRGIRLKEIPFEIINTDYLGPCVRKPPLQDICDMNLAHYRASAIYENALYYQGTPIYYIRGPGNDPNLNLEVGPKAIWLLDKDDVPGVLNADLNLSSLENSLEGKEAQIQSLGGKLIGQRKNAAAKSAVSEDIGIQGEEAILLKIVKTSSDGLTNVLRWLARFGNYKTDECIVNINEQFYRPKIGARELRSISSLFDSGLLPDEGAYQNLKEAGFLGNDITFEMFQQVADEARARQEAGMADSAGPKPAPAPAAPATPPAAAGT